jgi:hypothetical protein
MMMMMMMIKMSIARRVRKGWTGGGRIKEVVAREKINQKD